MVGSLIHEREKVAACKVRVPFDMRETSLAAYRANDRASLVSNLSHVGPQRPTRPPPRKPLHNAEIVATNDNALAFCDQAVAPRYMKGVRDRFRLGGECIGSLSDYSARFNDPASPVDPHDHDGPCSPALAIDRGVGENVDVSTLARHAQARFANSAARAK